MKKLNGDKQMTDVWQLPSIGKWEKSCGKHPTQKPLGVLVRIIQASSEPHSWILDPFSGSGSTGIAANLLGRNYLGLEKAEDFLLMSNKRREEMENPSVRINYLKHLEKNGMISQSEDFLLSDSSVLQYGIPWL